MHFQYYYHYVQVVRSSSIKKCSHVQQFGNFRKKSLESVATRYRHNRDIIRNDQNYAEGFFSGSCQIAARGCISRYCCYVPLVCSGSTKNANAGSNNKIGISAQRTASNNACYETSFVPIVTFRKLHIESTSNTCIYHIPIQGSLPFLLLLRGGSGWNGLRKCQDWEKV